MKRIHLFEFGDMDWFPKGIRREGMELLATFFRILKSYDGTARLLNEIGQSEIVILAAGSGGGIEGVIPHLKPGTRVTLTDIFPDTSVVIEGASYEPTPVDATQVPAHLTGTRVMYTAFHHFQPPMAKKILEDAVRARVPIAIFEVTERSARGLLTTAFLPLLTFVLTPFVRPFRFSRLFFTYLVPVIPLFILWDGFVSSLRTYDEDELRELTKDLVDYEWKYVKLHGPTFERIAAFYGIPRV